MGLQSVLKDFKLSAVLTAIGELILGTFLILNPAASQFALCTLIGIAILIYGMLSIITYVRNHERYWDHARLLFGISALVLGIALLVNPGFLFSFTGTMLGFFIVISACSEIRRSLTLKEFGFIQWWTALLIGILFVCLGVSLILFPGFYGSLFMQFIGVFLLIEAVSDLLTIHRISEFAKNGTYNIVIRY